MLRSVFLGLVLASCEAASIPTQLDSGAQASADSGIIVTPDSGTSETPDSGTAFGPDAGVEPPDAGTEPPDASIPMTCTPAPERCDGLDNDCDNEADEDLIGCDRCSAYNELPVVTHWSASTSAQQYLAADQAMIYVEYPDGTYVPGACYPSFAPGLLPDYEHYIGDTWSITAIADSEANTFTRSACTLSGAPVRLLRPDAVNTERVRSRAGAVQIINGLIIDGSLATIILPANWSAAAPAGTYPIVANGFYDLNDNLFHQEGPDLTRLIALSAQSGRTGAIGVLWNGGGAVSSRTLNPKSLDQFNAVVNTVATQYSGDRHRILMFGGSRGGSTALAMASNIKGHDYTVTFVAAAVPPARVGEHSVLQSTTYPGLLAAASWTTGLGDAWRTGWTYPSCAGLPHLTGLTAPQAHLYILTGTSDPMIADLTLSVGGPAFINGLKAAGTHVYLEVGSHDFIVPYAHQVEYGAKLLAAEIPTHADVLIRGGHGARSEPGRVFSRVGLNRLWDALQTYLDPTQTGQRPSVAPGVDFYLVNRATHQIEAFARSDTAFPFTMEIPRYTSRGARFPIVLVGEIGTEWEVAILVPGESVPVLSTGTISSEWKSLLWVDVPADQPLGDHLVGLRIKKPGAASFVTIPSTNTIDGTAAIINVVEVEPNVSGGSAGVATLAGQIPGFEGTNWGISEY